MNRTMILLLFFAIPLVPCVGQVPVDAANPAPRVQRTAAAPAAIAESSNLLDLPRHTQAELPENLDDPAYAVYKEGYALILDERWEEARKRFDQLLMKYRKSAYRDDAAYWSAYALKHIDSRKALKLYEDFLRRYPGSSYFDDAVSDFAELQSRVSVTVPASPEPDTTGIAVTIENAPDPQGARSLSLSIKRLGHKLRTTNRIYRYEFDPTRMMLDVPDQGLMLARELAIEKLDRKTRLKVEALSALGSLKEDPKTVATLKEIALDRTQPRELRHVSLYSLSRLKDAELLPVFLEIAQKDTDTEVQGAAIYCIARTGHDKQKTLDLLTGIYRSTPERRTDQLEIVLEAIATVGTEQGMDFLVTVARTSNNPEIAGAAIDGIAQAANDKKKVVETLVRLYRETPKTRNEHREMILYSVADVGNDRAVDFLSTVALSDDNLDLRGNAIYLLGTIGGEKARTTLYRVLKGK